jgi:hypothetical protein
MLISQARHGDGTAVWAGVELAAVGAAGMFAGFVWQLRYWRPKGEVEAAAQMRRMIRFAIPFGILLATAAVRWPDSASFIVMMALIGPLQVGIPIQIARDTGHLPSWLQPVCADKAPRSN